MGETLALADPHCRLTLVDLDPDMVMAAGNRMSRFPGTRVQAADATDLPFTNRLLRQYLAKRADLRQFSMRDLDDIAHRINTRPRRVLDWATSAKLFLPRVRAAYLS